jgi:anaerobic magnesium-protoporphyrin IX monomethyl ester cyclase
MRVTFVHSHYENLGIEYMSAVLKAAGHRTDLAFEPALFHNFFANNKVLNNLFNFKAQMIKDIATRQPDIVAFSIIADNYQWCCDMAREIRKQCEAVIVFGGIHPTSVPQNVLQDGVADFIIRGEGEHAFLDLVTALESKEDPSGIANLGFYQDGRVVLNDVRPPVPDLSALPFPDKDLFYAECPRMIRGSYMIMGSRGCNNKCSYCWNSTIHNLYHGNTYFRRRSVNNIIEELQWAKEKYRIKRVTFYDEVFTSDKTWFKDFLSSYCEKIRLPYFCCIHPSDVDAEVVQVLEESGCSAVNIGMQTANEQTRRKILHRKGSNAEIITALSLLAKTKIFVYSNVILGLPGEGEEDVLETLRFCVENPADIPAIYWLRYYPGTEIVQIAHEHGVLSSTDVQHINASQDYAPYAISGNTYSKNISKLGNCILLSGVLPKSWMNTIIQRKWYRNMPSQNLLFPLIILSGFLKRLLKGKRNTYHYFNLGDYCIYYIYYFRKKMRGLLTR